MKITFYIESATKLKELLLETGCRKIYRIDNKPMTFPRDVIMVGNDNEKFLWS